MTHKQSRRTQRALERELFGPEPGPMRRMRPRSQPTIADLPKDKIGDCRFCANHTELGYRDDTWTCFMCGGVYVFGQTGPTNVGSDV